MSDLISYTFKAATGFGAVIDGLVTSTSVEQVKKDLLAQGLIPIAVSEERQERRVAPAIKLSKLASNGA